MISDLFYKIKWGLQKIFRGYSDIEIWNLDDTIIDFVLPRLKVFRKQTNGYPPNLGSFEEWEDILDKIIWAFEYYNQDSTYFDLKEKYGDEKTETGRFRYLEEYEALEERAEEGFELFGKYFRNFWW